MKIRKSSTLSFLFLVGLMTHIIGGGFTAFAADPIVGDSCDLIWGSVLDNDSKKPLICLPKNPNDVTALEFKLDASEFPPALDPVGAIAFGRTCPDSLGVKEKDLHGNQVECVVSKERESNKQIWYSDVIAQSILSGIPIPKETPKPIKSSSPTPTPEPEVSPTPEQKPIEKIQVDDQPGEIDKNTKKKITHLVTVGAQVLALAVTGHTVSAAVGSNNPNLPKQDSPSPKDLLSTEIESRRRKKLEQVSGQDSDELPIFLQRLRRLYTKVAKISLFAYELFSDGNYLRVYSYWVNRALYALSAGLGLWIALQNSTMGHAINEISLTIFIVLGIFDTSAGLLAILAFLLGEFYKLEAYNHLGSLISANYLVILLLPMITLVPNFVGSAIRPMDRDKKNYESSSGIREHDYLWDKSTDIALTTAVTAWVGSHAMSGIQYLHRVDESTEGMAINPIFIFICASLIRHGIQSYTYISESLKRKRIQLELTEDEINTQKQWPVFIKIIITAIILSKILESAIPSFETSSIATKILVCLIMSVLISISEIVKPFTKGPDQRSERLSFLNLQSPTKFMILLIVSWIFEKIWVHESKPDIGASLVIFGLAGLIIFFGLVEIFVKRKNDQDNWHEKYKNGYYAAGIIYFSVLLASLFELGPFS